MLRLIRYVQRCLSFLKPLIQAFLDAWSVSHSILSRVVVSTYDHNCVSTRLFSTCKAHFQDLDGCKQGLAGVVKGMHVTTYHHADHCTYYAALDWLDMRSSWVMCAMHA